MKTAHPFFAQLATVVAGTLMLVMSIAFVAIPMSLTEPAGDTPQVRHPS
ncbi:MAG: hypothetical protein Fur0039_18430 [Rhodocyclaceae bacterium]